MISSFSLAEHVVGVIVEGDIDHELMNVIEQHVEDKMDNHDAINIFIEIKRGSNVSLTALISDLKFNFNHSKRFDKIAVVTEKHSLEAFMSIKDLILKSEVKTFPHEERIAALNWISH